MKEYYEAIRQVGILAALQGKYDANNTEEISSDALFFIWQNALKKVGIFGSSFSTLPVEEQKSYFPPDSPFAYTRLVNRWMESARKAQGSKLN